MIWLVIFYASGGRGGGVGLVAAMPEGLRLQGEIQGAGEAPVCVTVVRREGVNNQGVLKHQRRLNRGEAHVIAYRSTTCSVEFSSELLLTHSNPHLSVTPAELMRRSIGPKHVLRSGWPCITSRPVIFIPGDVSLIVRTCSIKNSMHMLPFPPPPPSLPPSPSSPPPSHTHTPLIACSVLTPTVRHILVLPVKTRHKLLHD